MNDTQAQPPVATLAHGGAESETEAFLRGLGYNDQLHLLVWLCQADPDLAARGAGALIEYHAAAAERRRVAHNRDSKTRRNRRRRQQSAMVA